MTAIYQGNVKRLLAYSSVAQIGYMVLGISLASVTGLTAGLLHLFNHALIKATLFMAMGAVMYRVGSVRMEAMQGLGKKDALDHGRLRGWGALPHRRARHGGIHQQMVSWCWGRGAGAVGRGGSGSGGSLLAVVYIWKVVEAAYFQDFLGELEVREAPLSLLIPIWTLVVANIYFGIDATLTAGIAGRPPNCSSG